MFYFNIFENVMYSFGKAEFSASLLQYYVTWSFYADLVLMEHFLLSVMKTVLINVYGNHYTFFQDN